MREPGTLLWAGIACGCFLCGCTILPIVGWKSRSAGEMTIQDEAVKRGYAEWVVDADHKPVFRWKEPERGK